MVIDTASGVQYYFGYDAKDQGLSDVAPNPAVDDAKIPFSLTEMGTVTLEIFSTNGELVSTLVDGKKYIPGKYSARVPVSELQGGAYVVRLRVNDQVYTQKFSVAK
jgi:hypothetical protein